MHLRAKPRAVVLGTMSKMPVAGIVFITIQYLLGLKRLGFDVYYVEAHARTPSTFMTDGNDGSAGASAFIDELMRRFDLGGDRGAFHALHDGGQCYGMSEQALARLYLDAAFILNLHGGTAPRPEHYATGRLVYVGTDPVAHEVEVHDGVHHDRYPPPTTRLRGARIMAAPIVVSRRPTASSSSPRDSRSCWICGSNFTPDRRPRLRPLATGASCGGRSR
jgi:hypothetical protein